MAKPGTFLGELSAGGQRFLRAHWGWQILVLALICLVFVLPLTSGTPVGGLAGFALTVLAFILLRAFAGSGAPAPAAEDQAPPASPRAGRQPPIARPRYCAHCGQIFDAAQTECPSCGRAAAEYPEEADLATLAGLLDRLAADHRRGRLDWATFQRLREAYEPALRALRTAPPPGAVEQPPAPSPIKEEPGFAPKPAVAAEVIAPPPPEPIPQLAATAATAAAIVMPAPEPLEPATPFGEVVAAWAAERQADILLYLGAFLISMAAIIFLSYQGEAVGPFARVTILTVYTVAFLGLGLLLHRWERAREAGPVFLALGAILVPIDFAAALRIEALKDEGIPADVLWLLGSASSAALYSLLARRGYGRYYVVPAIPAILVAWGALGSVLNLPPEWFGAWYQLVAAALYMAGSSRRLPLAGLVRRGAFLLGSLSLLYASLAAFSEVHHWQLPVAWAVATLALTGSLRLRRSVTGLALAPLTSAATATAFTWVAASPDPDWYVPFLAAAGLGYLLIARFDRPDARVWWQTAAFAPWIIALAAAAVFAGEQDPAKFALPVTLAVTTAGPAAGLATWRLDWRPGIAVLPPLAAATCAAFLWAWADMPPEWLGIWIAAAAIGYGLTAEYDRAYRQAWQTTALGAAAGAVIALHVAFLLVENPRAHPFALPATYAVLAIAVAGGVARWHLSWRPGIAALPALAAAAGASLLWAWFDLDPQWSACWIAAGALGYLVVADADRDYRAAWQSTALVPGAVAIVLAIGAASGADPGANIEFLLPATLAILAAGTAAGIGRWRLNWRTGIAILPPLAAATAGSLAWAWLEMPVEWAPPWIAAAAVAYLAAAAFDSKFRQAWQTAAMATGAIALGGAVAAIIDVDRDSTREFVLALTLFVLTPGAASGVIGWRLGWRPGIAVLPALTSATGATLLWAALDMPPVWTGAWLAGAAAGYLLPAEFDPRYRYSWRVVALAIGGGGLFAAHVAAGGDLPQPAQLPVTYAIALAATLVDAATRRDWSLLGPPALAAGLGATTLWAAGAGPEWWGFPALALAAIGAVSERFWRRDATSAAWGWGYVLALSSVPAILSLGAFNDAPANGLAASAVTAAIFGIAAWRCRGALATPFLRSTQLASHPGATLLSEQATFAYAGAAFLLGAGGYLNDTLEIAAADRAWVFLALASIAWLSGSVSGRAGYSGPSLAVPPALFASSLAAGLAAESPGIATIVLASAAAMPALAFATTRFPPFWLISAIYASLAVWAFWTWAEFAEWTLPGAYGASGALTWLALFGIRRYGRFEAMRDTTIHVLSWAPWIVASIVAFALLDDRAARLGEGEILAQTSEWGMLVAILAGASAALSIEGWRLHNRYVQQAGTAGLLAAILMAVAVSDPSNIQSYTAPIGLYLVGSGLTFRSSLPLFGRHMDLHETLIVAGALFIVLPPAEQGLEPGGENFGFELIGIGLAFLLVGLVLHARWLIPASVLTITGVAVRWVTGGFVDVPFWLILGIVGTLLLAAGTFILLQRERWDTWRDGARNWWLETTTGPPPPTPGVPPTG